MSPTISPIMSSTLDYSLLEKEIKKILKEENMDLKYVTTTSEKNKNKK